ncbi:MAG TPA: TlpA disulfide reductase family protein [Candidatus Polarisedimenticolaceae bacterium]|nr:TlpA disulfide reductase family protein [Candidatus Polarisedimenticolaceae bacterium]
MKSLPLLALSMSLVVAACGGGGGASATAAPSAGAGAEQTLAPEFELPALTGDTIQLSDSAGRVRLIDFWATWCPPCRDEIPMLNELHRTYQDAGLTILAISDESTDVVREFAEEIGMDYTNLIDPGEVSQAYRVLGLPTAFLIDQEGRIVQSYMGPKPRKMLEQKIRELLRLPPG